MADAPPLFEVTATVDFGKDRGQNFGTLFECRDAEGKLLAGAGFTGVYNTHFRHDRHTLQFFVRPLTPRMSVERLPRPTDDSGCYMFDYDGHLYAASHIQDRVFRRWDEAAGRWIGEGGFDSAAHRSGDMVMGVAGKPLRCIDSQVHYGGECLLGRPRVGYYHHFYYAAGHLTFFHNNRDGDPAFSRLYACPWDPGMDQPIDLERAAVLDALVPGETTFAIGQFRGKILYASNLGGVYRFDGEAWQVLRPRQQSGSYQLYSMLDWHDRMLTAHYPSGHLHAYDGETIREIDDWPPRMPGVSGASREAQTTCLYGGDLYVGVWPWAELWRHDANTDAWSFVQRMFTQPPLTEAVDHPWEQELLDYNAAHGTDIVFNIWGHRVTGLVPMGESLYVSTSAKSPWPSEQRPDFLADDAWQEYGRVYRLTVPGVLSAPIEWKDGPTTLQFAVSGDRIRITQDGAVLAEAPAPPADLDGQITWAEGVFGPLGGKMTDHHADVRSQVPQEN